jgi:hypothetical protein
LISCLATDTNPKQWLHMPEQEMSALTNQIVDQNLKLTLAFGIALHHAGLNDKDRKIVEELFVNQKIQILIATSTLAWGVNFPAHLVIVKGTEYFDGKTKRYVDFPITDVLQMMVISFAGLNLFLFVKFSNVFIDNSREELDDLSLTIKAQQLLWYLKKDSTHPNNL